MIFRLVRCFQEPETRECTMFLRLKWTPDHRACTTSLPLHKG